MNPMSKELVEFFEKLTAQEQELMLYLFKNDANFKLFNDKVVDHNFRLIKEIDSLKEEIMMWRRQCREEDE